MKKLSKILILALSLALIIGAVAVIASAQAGEDNLIEFSVNGTVDSNVTTYEAALAAIRKGKVGGADYRIKLLGDLTVTTAFDLSDSLCNVVGTNTAGAGDDHVKRKTVIDLNGYDVDATAVNTVLFKLQRAERSVTVTGSGNITLGNYGFIQTI
jgi:hypothetical protein